METPAVLSLGPVLLHRPLFFYVLGSRTGCCFPAAAPEAQQLFQQPDPCPPVCPGALSDPLPPRDRGRRRWPTSHCTPTSAAARPARRCGQQQPARQGPLPDPTQRCHPIPPNCCPLSGPGKHQPSVDPKHPPADTKPPPRPASGSGT